MRIWKWAILLLVAAGMNYGVAWYCVWRSEDASANSSAIGVDDVPLEWPTRPPEDWPTSPGRVWASEYTWIRMFQSQHIALRRGGVIERTNFRRDYGWPLRSVWDGGSSEQLAHSGMGSTPPVTIRLAHVAMPPNQAWLPITGLPIGVHWWLFAVNALIYGAAISGVWLGLGWVRRWRRRTRGLCVECSYPIGLGAVCSECGAAIKERAA